MNRNIKNIAFRNMKDGSLEVDICAIPDWEGFDKLIRFLKKEYGVDVIQSFDGPDARRWILNLKGHEFELIHHDGYGNYMVGKTLISQKLIREIGLDIEKRLETE
jgi:hypothetical protein